MTVAVTMVEAHGTLCGRCRGGKASTPTRCWPHEQFPDAPAICGRCRQVVDGMVESGDLTPDVLDPPRPYPPEADCLVCAGPCKALWRPIVQSTPPPTPPLTTTPPHDTLEVGGMPKRESPM